MFNDDVSQTSMSYCSNRMLVNDQVQNKLSHTHMHARTCTRMHARTQTHTHTHTHTHRHTCTHTHTHTHTHNTHTHTCTHTNVHMHTCGSHDSLEFQLWEQMMQTNSRWKWFIISSVNQSAFDHQVVWIALCHTSKKVNEWRTINSGKSKRAGNSTALSHKVGEGRG